MDQLISIQTMNEWCCALSCPALCNPLDCSSSDSSIRGIFQARTLEWVAISSSRGSSWPRDGNSHLLSPALKAVSLIAELSGKPQYHTNMSQNWMIWIPIIQFWLTQVKYDWIYDYKKKVFVLYQVLFSFRQWSASAWITLKRPSF